MRAPPRRDRGAVEHVYCINLARRPDRWRRTQALFRRRGLPVERFAATDGRRVDLASVPPSLVELEYDTTRNARWDRHVRPGQRRRLTAGELGCALSHLAVWDDLLTRGHRSALVVEDDVALARGFTTRLARVLGELRRPWDLVYLGYVNTAGPIRLTGAHVGTPEHLFGTYAYLVSRRGARRLLELLPVVEPIDNFMAASFPELDVRCAVPALVSPRHDADSDIVHSAHLDHERAAG